MNQKNLEISSTDSTKQNPPPVVSALKDSTCASQKIFFIRFLNIFWNQTIEPFYLRVETRKYFVVA